MYPALHSVGMPDPFASIHHSSSIHCSTGRDSLNDSDCCEHENKIGFSESNSYNHAKKPDTNTALPTVKWSSLRSELDELRSSYAAGLTKVSMYTCTLLAINVKAIF
jgi:hypothetical protein